MPSAKHFSTALIVGLNLSFSLTVGSAFADNCLPSSVDLMRITGDEDVSAMGQVASLANTATRSAHLWESNHAGRVDQAARIARVGDYAPTPAASVDIQADSGAGGSSLSAIDQSVQSSHSAPRSSVTSKAISMSDSVTPVSANSSATATAVRTVPKSQSNVVKAHAIKRAR